VSICNFSVSLCRVFKLTHNGPQIAAGGQISRFQVLSSFAVQDYEKVVNKASSPRWQQSVVSIWHNCFREPGSFFMFGYAI
jgi:hypothetical protein